MIPIWAIFLLIIIFVVVFLILNHYSPSTAGLVKSFIKKYWFIIVLVVGYFIVFNYWGFFEPRPVNEGGDLFGRKANTYLLVGFLLWFIYRNFIGNARYHTPQIICKNGFHGSVSSPPIFTYDGFAIFNIGSILWGVELPFGDKTLVTRIETVRQLGAGNKANYFCIASPSRRDITKLTPDCKVEVKNNFWLNKDEVFYGWFDDVEEIKFPEELLEEISKMKNDEFFGELFNVKNPKVEDLLRAFENLSASYNKLQEQHDKATESIEDYDEHIRRRTQSWGRIKSKPEVVEGGGT